MANWRLSALCLAVLLCGGCSEPPAPEQRVREFIGEIETLAEAREYGELLERIAGDYLDSRGHDKLAAAGILRAFYLRNKSVHLLIRIGEIHFPAPDRASVTLYLAMARQPFTGEESASMPRTNMHRVEVDLAESGDSYEILQTEWQRAGAGEFIW